MYPLVIAKNLTILKSNKCTMFKKLKNDKARVIPFYLTSTVIKDHFKMQKKNIYETITNKERKKYQNKL